MKVYVVMGNDYPDAVFADARKADAFVEQNMTDPKNRHEGSRTPRVYYCAYEFEVRE